MSDFDIELAKEEIKEKMRLIKSLNDEVFNIKRDIAKHLCPFSIGDSVIDKNGYGGIVCGIHFFTYSTAAVEINGFKKDGTLLKRTKTYYWENDLKLAGDLCANTV